MRWLSVMRLAKVVRSNVDRQLSSSGRSGRDREAGAVAMIVAMLFGFGVLLGLGALVLDTGSLLYERRQLQNGADAAAMAVGKECAGNPACAPDKSASSSLTVLAGANASDTLTTIESICGNSVAQASNPKLTETCPTISTGQLVDCPLPVPSTFASAPFIEVRTATNTGATSSNQSILPPILAQTLVGGGYKGETVKACARVAWLPAGEPTGPVLPVAFSYCQWAQATNFVSGGDEPDFPLPPNYPDSYPEPPEPPGPLNPGYGAAPNTPWPTTEWKLLTQTTPPTVEPCDTWNNHVAPGTFGELTNIDCAATVTDNWVQGTNGEPAPCQDLTLFDKLRGQIVNVPIFDCYTPTIFDILDLENPPEPYPNCNDPSPNNWYHISGYAAFYLTGFNFSGSPNEGRSIFPPDHKQQPCSGSDRCISGWFTTGSLPATPGVFGPPFFGLYELQFAG